MVHHTMNTRISSAASASSSNRVMRSSVGRAWTALRVVIVGVVAASLGSCAIAPDRPLPPVTASPAATPPVSQAVPVVPDEDPLPPAIQRGKSRWVPARWNELPGWGQDRLHEVWNAWVRGCERPAEGHAALCREARQRSIATADEQLAWLQSRFRPYRVLNADGSTPDGLLTGYYEPILPASRVRTDTHRVPLYGPPPGLRRGQAWYTRQQIDTHPDAQAALRGREIAWLADPVDALILQIQGSGRLQVTEADGRTREVRVAFAGHNGQPYMSVGRWLLDRRYIRDASWDAIKAWAAQNPGRLNDMLWANPRTVFFREEVLSDLDARFGPRGAQGVPLTPGRSIAVDPQSIPYGTPVWLATQGEALNARRLVMAQDTGGAIVGAARADLFTGWGGWNDEAYTVAAALKQPLQLWVLWPR
ncbi:MAG: MltA domain-containing protein [Burkholderiaceae bacterium]